MCIVTVYVWHKWILERDDNQRNLLLKIVNYDAGSTYTAILSISLVWAAYKNDNEKKWFSWEVWQLEWG